MSRQDFASTINQLPTEVPPNVGQARRMFWQWWRQQSPTTQDRYATLGPLISVMLFLAAIMAAFWFLRNEEIEREQESVKRDTEVVQQQLRLRLLENQEQLLRVAREVNRRDVVTDPFFAQTSDFLRTRPEVVGVSWRYPTERGKSGGQRGQELVLDRTPLDNSNGANSPFGDMPDLTTPIELSPVSEQDASRLAFVMARKQRQPVFSQAFTNARGLQVIQVHLPLIDRGEFVGTLVAEYSLDVLMRVSVPKEIGSRHAMSLVQVSGRTLTVGNTALAEDGARPSFIHEVIVTPVGNGLLLRGEGFKTSSSLIGNTLFWMVVALSGFTVWTLMGTLQHMRRRSDIQRELVQETNFRRAMENSMLTGMRTIDLEGRITYVNPAFCAMTGFSEAELIGCTPPYPYWPKDRLDEFNRMFQQELLGRSPAGGLELQIQRRDGTTFDARMYVSPLIDAQGEHTGWMSSVTNITEAKRVRDQLSAAHERFTTVLEGLDAAVSVVSVQQQALLFANRSYRLWFGGNPQAHLQLAGGEKHDESWGDLEDMVDSFGGLPAQEITDAGGDIREVFVESVQKWFDVRARYIQWTDGRLAQMLIATDITERRMAEEASARQAEKAQFTSRLITMGEMASTVAHELNQPLAAISNYCSGMISRIRSGAIDNDGLIEALEKTSRQAQRAGQVIHRIRQFVKRSEPQRQEARVRDITDAVVDLASFEMKRRRVTLNAVVAQRLPAINVDPILIEQVLLNLLKNAAEAIDNAEMPQSRRVVDLRVGLKLTPDQGMVVEFAVSDGGPGMDETKLDKLFEAFSSTKADGLGIGLSLCRSIIESHKGRIQAENIYNNDAVTGCRFTFTLPIEESLVEGAI
jgi:PAS domain S-box-containing protein